MHFTRDLIDAIATPTTNFMYNQNNSTSSSSMLLPTLEERLHAPIVATKTTATTTSTTTAKAVTLMASTLLQLPAITAIASSDLNSSTGKLSTIGRIASIVVSNFRSPPLTSTTTDTIASAAIVTTAQPPSTTIRNTTAGIIDNHLSQNAAIANATTASATTATTITLNNQLPINYYPTFNPPAIENLVVANSAEEFNNNLKHQHQHHQHLQHHDNVNNNSNNDGDDNDNLSFDIFDDNVNNLYGSPLTFDASENGLWNGRFVPPPPRPPYFIDEANRDETNILSDGLTTCDLCTWAMPPTTTKSTSFIFESSMEKASDLGWPLTLTIVSILSALLGAIIMITVVKCRRRKSSHQRSSSSETHVQWWSRNKRPNNNNNHLRRSNIYTAHPADSIRGLQSNSLSATSSVIGMLGDVMPFSSAASTSGSGTGIASATATATATAPPAPTLSADATHLTFYRQGNLLPEQLNVQPEGQRQQQGEHQQVELDQQLQQYEYDHNYQRQHLNHHHHHHHHTNHQHENDHNLSKTIESVNALRNNAIQQQQQQQQQQHQQEESAQYKLNLPESIQLQRHQQHQQQQQPQQIITHETEENRFHWPTATALVNS